MPTGLFVDRRTIDKWCCDYNDDVRSLVSFGAANTETLAELSAAFFAFWAWDFNYGRDVVSIRTGSLLSKHEKVGPGRSSWALQQHAL